MSFNSYQIKQEKYATATQINFFFATTTSKHL